MSSSRVDPFLPLSPLTTSILLALGEERRHGYAIIKAIERESSGRLSPTAGSLYAALERLVQEGLIAPARRKPRAGEDQRRRYYEITRLGRDVAQAELLRLAQQVRAGAATKLLRGVTVRLSDAED